MQFEGRRLWARLIIRILALNLIVALLSVATALAVGRVLPTWDELLYPAGYDPFWNLYVMDVNRGLSVNLLGNNLPLNVRRVSASWSPDGREVLYVSDADGGYKIFRLDPNTSVERRLLTDEMTYYPHWNPVWSPDGQYIAFVSYFESVSQTGVYLMPTSGKDASPHRIADIGTQFMAWSPDSQRLAFLGRIDGEPAFSLMVAEVEDMGSANSLMLGIAPDSNLMWSPNGKQLIFDSSRSGDYEIYVADVEKGIVRNLTHNVSADFRPAWSPDGRQIAFTSDRDDDLEIYVMDADGRNVRQLTHNSYAVSGPLWSPDGYRLAFLGQPEHDSELYVMDADGSNLRRLTYNDINELPPVWRPHR
jgi:TolB protein